MVDVPLPSTHPVCCRDILEPDALRVLLVPDELRHPAGGSRLSGIDGGLILDLQISETGDALLGAGGAETLPIISSGTICWMNANNCTRISTPAIIAKKQAAVMIP